MADILEIKRRESLLPQLGALLAQPFAQQQKQTQDLQSLLLPTIFKAAIERAQRNEILDRLHQGGNGPMGEYKIKYNSDGSFSYEQKTDKEKLDERLAKKRLGATIPQVVSDAVPAMESQVPPIVSGETTPPQFIRNPNYPAEDKEFIENPDIKGVAGEVATKFSGAKQGIENIRRIAQTLDLYIDPETKRAMVGKNQDALIRSANRVIESANAKDTFLPMAKGIYRATKLARTTPEASSLANEFMTLSENILRARTGAQAPDPEVVREYARTLLRTYTENPETWQRKLDLELQFLRDTVKAVRPREAVNTNTIWNKRSDTGVSETGLPQVGQMFNGGKVLSIKRTK